MTGKEWQEEQKRKSLLAQINKEKLMEDDRKWYEKLRDGLKFVWKKVKAFLWYLHKKLFGN